MAQNSKISWTDHVSMILYEHGTNKRRRYQSTSKKVRGVGRAILRTNQAGA